jgi:hypothetical protein
MSLDVFMTIFYGIICLSCLIYLGILNRVSRHEQNSLKSIEFDRSKFVTKSAILAFFAMFIIFLINVLI